MLRDAVAKLVVGLIALGGCTLAFPVVEIDSRVADSGSDADASKDASAVTCPLENLLADLGSFETGITAWRSAAEVDATLESTAEALNGNASLKLCAPATTNTTFYAADLNTAFRIPSPKSGRYLLRAELAPAGTEPAPRARLGIDTLIGTTRIMGPRSVLRAAPAGRTCIAEIMLVSAPDGGSTFLDPAVIFQNTMSASCVRVDDVSLYYLGSATSIPSGCDCP
jgi:hypothetical protein